MDKTPSTPKAIKINGQDPSAPKDSKIIRGKKDFPSLSLQEPQA